jgi:hypothetical protein
MLMQNFNDYDEENADSSVEEIESEPATLRLLNSARRGNKFDNTDRQGLFNFLSFLASSASLFFSLILLGLYFSLNNKPLPSLVQTSDGKTIRVIAQNSIERSPEVIKSTAVIGLNKLFTWRSFYIPTNSREVVSPKPDPGIEIQAKANEGGGKIPTTVYEGSFILTGDFQTPFLATLAPLVKEAGVFTNNAQVSIELINVSDKPVSVGPGLWRVDVVANLVRVLPNKTITRLKFNKQVFLKAVASIPIDDQGATNGEALLSRLVAEGSATGLQIYAIKDLSSDDINLYPNPTATASPTPTPTPSAKVLNASPSPSP